MDGFRYTAKISGAISGRQSDKVCQTHLVKFMSSPLSMDAVCFPCVLHIYKVSFTFSTLVCLYLKKAPYFASCGVKNIKYTVLIWMLCALKLGHNANIWRQTMWCISHSDSKEAIMHHCCLLNDTLPFLEEPRLLARIVWMCFIAIWSCLPGNASHQASTFQDILKNAPDII